MKRFTTRTSTAKWYLQLMLAIAPLALMLSPALQNPAAAQAGSEGGSIGKQNKSVGGTEENAETVHPSRPRAQRAFHSPIANAVPSPCRGMAGNWNWSSGGVAIVGAGGTLKKGDLTATWTCKGGDVHIVWNHGYIDDLKLDPDAGKLSGKNNRGFGISGARTN